MSETLIVYNKKNIFNSFLSNTRILLTDPGRKNLLFTFLSDLSPFLVLFRFILRPQLERFHSCSIPVEAPGFSPVKRLLLSVLGFSPGACAFARDVRIHQL